MDVASHEHKGEKLRSKVGRILYGGETVLPRGREVVPEPIGHAVLRRDKIVTGTVYSFDG